MHSNATSLKKIDCAHSHQDQYKACGSEELQDLIDFKCFKAISQNLIT